MLLIFRKIRKSFVKSGAGRKYFIYAIGEILLVVIGILIALQINIWNENRKERKKEQIILKEIIANLEKNNETVNERLFWIQKFKASGQIISDALEGKIPYSDSLHQHFLNARFSGIGDLDGLFSTAGYTALELAGYDILKSDTIKLEIIEMFETTIPVLTSLESRIDSKLRDYYFENFKDSNIPRDFKHLMNDPVYYEMIRYLIGFRDRTSNRISNYLRDSEALIHNILTEYKGLE